MRKIEVADLLDALATSSNCLADRPKPEAAGKLLAGYTVAKNAAV